MYDAKRRHFKYAEPVCLSIENSPWKFLVFCNVFIIIWLQIRIPSAGPDSEGRIGKTGLYDICLLHFCVGELMIVQEPFTFLYYVLLCLTPFFCIR